jgi:hypothetical protein
MEEGPGELRRTQSEPYRVIDEPSKIFCQHMSVVLRNSASAVRERNYAKPVRPRLSHTQEHVIHVACAVRFSDFALDGTFDYKTWFLGERMRAKHISAL